MGSRNVDPLIPNLGAISNQLHALAHVACGKDSLQRIEERLGLAPEQYVALRKRQISCFCWELGHNSLVIQPLTYSRYRLSYSGCSWCQNLFSNISL
jgi:hypothetical protein